MIYTAQGLWGPVAVEYFESGELHPSDVAKEEPKMTADEKALADLLGVRLGFCEAMEESGRELFEAACRAQMATDGRPIIYESGDASLARDEYERLFRERLAAENAVNNLRIAVHARALRDEQPPAPVVAAPASREALLQDMRARLLGRSSRKGKAA